jgi:carbon monoxide dehydrogenase subunit G
MKLDGDYVFDAAVQDVWDALFDPAVLAAVLPGCEKLDLVDGQYVGEIKVKVGPIQGKFTGKVDLFDKVEPTSYSMKIDGRGAQGFVNATANIVLAAEGAGTRIKYTSESNIGGKIASVGSRLVETSAKAIVKQSLEGLNENIKLRVAAYREHAAKSEAPAAPTSEPAAKSEAPAAPTSEPAATIDEPAATPSNPVEPEAATNEPIASPDRSAPPPADEPAASSVEPSKPVVEYKKADVGKLGAAVAKEVGKSLAPYLLAGALVIGVVLYLLLR